MEKKQRFMFIMEADASCLASLWFFLESQAIDDIPYIHIMINGKRPILQIKVIVAFLNIYLNSKRYGGKDEIYEEFWKYFSWSLVERSLNEYNKAFIQPLRSNLVDMVHYATPSGRYDAIFLYSDLRSLKMDILDYQTHNLYVLNNNYEVPETFDPLGARTLIIESGIFPDEEEEKQEIINEWLHRCGEGKSIYEFLSMVSKNECHENENLKYKCNYINIAKFSLTVLHIFKSYFEEDQANRGFFRLSSSNILGEETDFKKEIIANVKLCLLALFTEKTSVI